MPLAVSLPIPGVPLDRLTGFVRECGDHGYRAVWGSEVNGPDFPSLLGAVAATCDLDIGVAVAPVQTRSAWLLAATASTLSHLSGGRFTLGLGTSSEVIVGQWSGLPFERPLTHLAETVAVVRAMLAGEKVAHEGAFATSGYRIFAPPPAPVPIVVGALNPRSLRQAGRIGDGVALNQLGPGHVPVVLDEVRAGAAEVGRELDGGFAVVARLFCLVTDQPDAARQLLRGFFAPYLATTVYNRFYRWLGFPEEAEAVLAARGAGDRAAAAAAVSDRILDAITAIGDADEVAARVQAYVDAGVTTPVIAVLGASPEDARRTLHAVGDRVRVP